VTERLHNRAEPRRSDTCTSIFALTNPAINMDYFLLAPDMPVRRLVLIVVLCVSCTQQEVMTDVTSRIVSCPAEELVLGDIQREGTRPRTWTASCGATTWQCGNKGGRVTCRSGDRACWDSWGKLICDEHAPVPPS
jgi:hypothetical protein